MRDEAAQITGFSVEHGHVGYLRECVIYGETDPAGWPGIAELSRFRGPLRAQGSRDRRAVSHHREHLARAHPTLTRRVRCASANPDAEWRGLDDLVLDASHGGERDRSAMVARGVGGPDFEVGGLYQ